MRTSIRGVRASASLKVGKLRRKPIETLQGFRGLRAVASLQRASFRSLTEWRIG
jgi:hypothetical protein